MNIPCKHWSEGACKLGLYGGRPSPGVCLLACNSYAGSDAERLELRKAIKAGTPTTCGGGIEWWMGLAWYGRPWPRRWRLRGWRLERIQGYPGCGCVVLLKDLASVLKRQRALYGKRRAARMTARTAEA